MGGLIAEMTKWIFIFFYLSQYVNAQRSVLEEQKIYYLNLDDSVENNNTGLKTYCHNPTTKYLTHIWKTMTIHLNISSDSYIIYHGKTPFDIRQKHEKNKTLLDDDFYDTREQDMELKINPFEDICIGVYIYPSSKFEYIMKMTEIPVDVWNLTMMLTGIIIFWLAQILSHNSLFYNVYYICIILPANIPVIMTLILGDHFSQRGEFGLLLLLLGTSMFHYVIGLHVLLFWIRHKKLLVLGYSIISFLTSFIIFYRFRQLNNKETKQIIQWFLQFVGLIMVFASSYFYEATISCCIVLIFLRAAFELGKNYWYGMPEIDDDEFDLDENMSLLESFSAPILPDEEPVAKSVRKKKPSKKIVFNKKIRKFLRVRNKYRLSHSYE